MTWPTAQTAETFAPVEGVERHRLDVYLDGGRAVEVLLDGESVLPTWFKLEFKENGELSAKVKGVKLATRLGDEITLHLGPPVP